MVVDVCAAVACELWSERACQVQRWQKGLALMKKQRARREALSTYERKRDFRRTPEPGPKRRARPKSAALAFVVQQHAARRMHYDFRLELDGVLKSWAVPKGPSLTPGERRLAVMTEDHPLDYQDFEGLIPEGEYGAGPVIVWDRGTWHPTKEPHAGLAEGKLEFELDGEKLHGGFTLVRLKRGSEPGKENWLLLKRHDDAATGQDLIETRPESVQTGRSIEELRGGAQDSVPSREKEPASTAELPGAKRGRMPDFVAPELATLVDTLPDGGDLLFELKLDGYRLLARKEDNEVRLATRTGQEFGGPLAWLRTAITKLPAKEAMLDGELVALDEHGLTDFQRLQNALGGTESSALAYYAFDLLFLDGYDLRGVPLEQRKNALQTLLAHNKEPQLRYCEHLRGSWREIFAQACRLGLEGIMAKRRESLYRSTRGRDWLKLKCKAGQEFVIGGFTEPRGSRTGFGALLVGVREGDALRFAGKVGTGFSDATIASLYKTLRRLEIPRSPFSNPVPLRRGVHWVRPELVGEVEYTQWTEGGMLRHPSFLGLRTDKPANDVQREEPAAIAEARPQHGSIVAGVSLSNPDRILWPEQGLTKLELARYFEAAAARMLPHVARRPLMLRRCPEGHRAQCFFQKHVMPGQPAALHTAEIFEGGHPAHALQIDSVEGLVSLAQLGALEVHIWGSTLAALEQPDRIVFDLDPDKSVPWSEVAAAAQQLRRVLEQLGLAAFLKTTGGKGLHVTAPLIPSADWDAVKSFSRAVTEQVVAANPSLLTSSARLRNRPKRIFIDYLRNGRGATAVAPYSPRAREGAPVAAPVSWQELDEGVRADSITLRESLRRLREPDPWREFFVRARRLDFAAESGVAMRKRGRAR